MVLHLRANGADQRIHGHCSGPRARSGRITAARAWSGSNTAARAGSTAASHDNVRESVHVKLELWALWALWAFWALWALWACSTL